MTGQVASRTEVGLVRRRNEDALYVGTHLFAVADGLGGHVAGDMASQTAIDALAAYDRPVQPSDLQDHLGRAVAAADLAIRRRVSDEPGLAGMGTTLVALLRSGPAAVLANVGDSRAYLLPGGSTSGHRAVRITEDHTYQHVVSAAWRVPNLPEKLARFLDGRVDGRSPDLIRLSLNAGDRLLLCTDGLSSYVDDELIHLGLAQESADGAVAQLVQSAMDNGGPDNVTVLVLDI
jgi:PPM family protein phosphatase